MCQKDHSFTLSERVLEPDILVKRNIHIAWPIDNIVLREREPVELTHVEEKSVKNLQLRLVDLLSKLLWQSTRALVVKVRLSLLSPLESAVMGAEIDGVIVWVTPSRLNHCPTCRLFLTFLFDCVKRQLSEAFLVKGQPVLGIERERC